jgi:hypothetical protein
MGWIGGRVGWGGDGVGDGEQEVSLKVFGDVSRYVACCILVEYAICVFVYTYKFGRRASMRAVSPISFLSSSFAFWCILGVLMPSRSVWIWKMVSVSIDMLMRFRKSSKICAADASTVSSVSIPSSLASSSFPARVVVMSSIARA